MNTLPKSPRRWLDECPARRRLCAWWLLLSRLPSHRQAVLVDSSVSVIQLLAQARGYDCLRVTSATLLEQHGVWIEPWLATHDVGVQLVPPAVQPVRLAARAGWREYQPPIQPGLPFSPPRPQKLRQETLAALLHGLPRVGLVWLNDAHYLAEILDGGMQALHEARPVIGFVLPPQTSPDLEKRFHELVASGYRFFDTAFRPCSERNLPRECIALPPEKSSLAATCRDWLMQQDVRLQSIERDIADQLLVHALEGAPAFLKAAIISRSLPTSLRDLPADHWHAAEAEGNYQWRWSGRASDSRLLLPIPAPGLYTLALRIMNTATEDLAGKAQLFINGQLQHGVGERLRPGASVGLPVAFEDDSWTGALELRIALPYTSRPNPDDPRWLGISLDALALHWSTS